MGEAEGPARQELANGVRRAPLGYVRKKIALLIVFLGCLTFFAPMVRLNPPLMGSAQWSPLNIAVALWHSSLPVSTGRFDEGLLEIFSLYALMAAAIPAIVFPKSPHALRVISGAGTVVSFFGKFWEHAFMYTFGWNYFGAEHMARGITWWVLPFIMPLLLVIAFCDFIDS